MKRSDCRFPITFWTRSIHPPPAELSRSVGRNRAEPHLYPRLSDAWSRWPTMGVMTLYDDDEEDWYDDPFVNASMSFEQNIRGKTRLLRNFNAVKFVALGGSGDWACNVGGRVFYSRPPSFRRAMRQSQDRGREVLVSFMTSAEDSLIHVSSQNVAFSCVTREWVIILDDGSIESCLSADVASAVREHMKVRHSLVRMPPPQILQQLETEDWRSVRSRLHLLRFSLDLNAPLQLHACFLMDGSTLTSLARKLNTSTRFSCQIH